MPLESELRQVEVTPSLKDRAKVPWLRKVSQQLIVAAAFVPGQSFVAPGQTYADEKGAPGVQKLDIKAYAQNKCQELSEEITALNQRKMEAEKTRDAALAIIASKIETYQRDFLEPKQFIELKRRYQVIHMNQLREQQRQPDDLAGIIHGHVADTLLEDTHAFEQKHMAEKQHGEYEKLQIEYDDTVFQWEGYFQDLQQETQKRIDLYKLYKGMIDAIENNESEDFVSEVL